jgi:hypothetical protein
MYTITPCVLGLDSLCNHGSASSRRLAYSLINQGALSETYQWITTFFNVLHWLVKCRGWGVGTPRPPLEVACGHPKGVAVQLATTLSLFNIFLKNNNNNLLRIIYLYF